MQILYSVAGHTGIAANTSWPYRLLVYYPKTTMPAKQSKAHQKAKQQLFDAMCKAHGLPLPDHEVQFHPTRKFRFDYLFEGWLAVERQGGIWSGGRHSGGKGQLADMEKFNLAVLLGYSVLQFTPKQLDSGEAFDFIKKVLMNEGEQS